MPLPPRRVFRAFKYAMYFDGVGYNVNVPSFTLNSQAFSIVMWIRKLNPQYATGYEWLIIKLSDTWFGEFSITLEHGGNSIFRIEGADKSENSVITGSYLEDLAWHNVVGMYDGARMYFYVDSALNASRTINKPRYITTSDIFIGRHGGGAHYPLLIYQVLLYSRALSDSEIQWNYQYPDNPVRSGLVLWLQADPNNVKDIDGDGVLEWVDLSGNNNHGKIYGATLVELIKTRKRLLSPARIQR